MRMSGLAPKPSAGHLGEIDALRGLGAVLVVLFHYLTRFPQIFPQAKSAPLALGGGQYWVLLFFAISGFAILFTMARIGSVADFAINRFSRLFPAYWAAIPLTLLVEHWGGVSSLEVPWTAVLVNFTMLQGFLYQPAVDGAYWTLAVELGFYASMVGLWLVLGRPMRRLEPVVLAWLGLACVAHEWDVLPYRLTLLLTLGFLPFFAIGMLYHRIWVGQRGWRAQLPYFAATLGTLAVTGPLGHFVAGLCLTVLFGVLVAGYGRFLCLRPLLWLGAISYPLYLLHQHIGFVVMLRMQGWGFAPWVGVCAALLLVVPLAALVHYGVERPAARRIGAWWKARRAG